MAAENEPFPSEKLGACLAHSPLEAFNAIKHFFSELKIFGEILSLRHEGIPYRILCDEQCFMVYRANDSSGSFHHVPGWPVCLVTSESIFEECSAPLLGEDHHSCELDILRWLQMVVAHMEQREGDTWL